MTYASQNTAPDVGPVKLQAVQLLKSNFQGRAERAGELVLQAADSALQN